jgi:hypothetical protein
MASFPIARTLIEMSYDDCPASIAEPRAIFESTHGDLS